MIRSLIAVEGLKVRQRQLTWLLLAILVLVIVVVYVLLWAVTESLAERQAMIAGGDAQELQRALFLDQSVPFGLQLTQVLGTFLVTLLAAASIGSEYDWGTLRPILTVVPSRAQFLASKLVAIAGFLVAGTLLGMITALVASFVISASNGAADYGFVDAAYIGDSVASYGRTLLAIAPYVAMAVFFSVVGRSTMAGIGFTLGILFLETIITSLLRLSSDVGEKFANVFPGANVDTLIRANNLEAALRYEQEQLGGQFYSLPTEWAALVLVGYVVAFLGASFVLFNRRDVT